MGWVWTRFSWQRSRQLMLNVFFECRVKDINLLEMNIIAHDAQWFYIDRVLCNRRIIDKGWCPIEHHWPIFRAKNKQEWLEIRGVYMLSLQQPHRLKLCGVEFNLPVTPSTNSWHQNLLEDSQWNIVAKRWIGLSMRLPQNNWEITWGQWREEGERSHYNNQGHCSEESFGEEY